MSWSHWKLPDPAGLYETVKGNKVRLSIVSTGTGLQREANGSFPAGCNWLCSLKIREKPSWQEMAVQNCNYFAHESSLTSSLYPLIAAVLASCWKLPNCFRCFPPLLFIVFIYRVSYISYTLECITVPPVLSNVDPVLRRFSGLFDFSWRSPACPWLISVCEWWVHLKFGAAAWCEELFTCILYPCTGFC